MADFGLKRLIQLILDKESANKVQKEVEGTTGRIDKSFKDLASKIAGYLGFAFLTKKVIDFGKSAVHEATEATAAWSELQGTIDGTGASFDKMEDKLQATAQAFQDATIHDDDEFAQGLTRVISLTGDVDASLNNMGLIANVAAKFFRGDLEPATNLVAKAMNGNLGALQKMGIHAKSAQEALEILSKRSMGAAEREAQTFGGQMKQLNVVWGNFKEAIGRAIISGDSATSALGVLKNALLKLTEWVVKNQDAINAWVTKAIHFAIDATDVFLRAILAVSGILGGAFTVTIGLSAQALAKLAKAYAIAANAGDAFWTMLGKNTKNDEARNQRILDQADAIDEWGKAVEDAGKKAAEFGRDMLLGPSLFSSKNLEKPPAAKTPGETNRPRTAGGVETDSQKKVREAFEEFEKAGLRMIALDQALGKEFDSVGADIDRTTKLLSVLAEEGQTSTDDFKALQMWLRALTDASTPLNQVLQKTAKSLREDLAVAALEGKSKLEMLQIEQKDLQQGMEAMIAEGADPASEAVRNFADRIRMLGDQIKQQETVGALDEQFKQFAHTLDADLAQAAANGATQLEMLIIEQKDLEKEMESLRQNGIDPTDERFKFLQERYRSVTEDIRDQTNQFDIQGKTIDELKDRQDELRQKMENLTKHGVMKQSEEYKILKEQYDQVTDAITMQTIAMEAQTVAADFLAEAMGAALEGGLHEAAVKKAKQNAIEAAEMLVRAGVFAIFGNFPAAGKALALAGEFAAVAAAWGALAATTHGSSSSGGGPSIPSASSAIAAGNSGQSLIQSRQSSNESSARATTPSAEISVYLVGPGFHALNPTVQKVVYGAQQQAVERYGPNARVRVQPSEP